MKTLFTPTPFILLNYTINKNAIDGLRKHLDLKFSLINLFDLKVSDAELLEKSTINGQIIEITYNNLH